MNLGVVAAKTSFFIYKSQMFWNRMQLLMKQKNFGAEFSWMRS